MNRRAKRTLETDSDDDDDDFGVGADIVDLLADSPASSRAVPTAPPRARSVAHNASHRAVTASTNHKQRSGELAPPADDAGSYEECTVAQLRDECRERELPATGTKSALVKRLTRDDSGVRSRQSTPAKRAPGNGSGGRNRYRSTMGSGKENSVLIPAASSATSAAIASSSSSATSSSPFGRSSSSDTQMKLSAMRTKLARLEAKIKACCDGAQAVPPKLLQTVLELQQQISEEEKAANSVVAKLEEELAKLQPPILSLGAKLTEAVLAARSDVAFKISAERNVLVRRSEKLKAELQAAKRTDSSPSEFSPVVPTPARSVADRTAAASRPPLRAAAPPAGDSDEDSVDDGFDADDWDLDLSPDDADSSTAVTYVGNSSSASSGFTSARMIGSSGGFGGDDAPNDTSPGVQYEDRGYANNNYISSSSSSSSSSSNAVHAAGGYSNSTSGGGGGWGGAAGGGAMVRGPLNFYEGSPQLRQQARQMFGHRSFRECQEDAIRTVLQGKDCFVLMPTGGFVLFAIACLSIAGCLWYANVSRNCTR